VVRRVWMRRGLRTQGVVSLAVPLGVLMALLAGSFLLDGATGGLMPGIGVRLFVAVQVGLVASVVLLAFGLFRFTRDLALLVTNSERLVSDLPLFPVAGSSAEVSRMGANLEQASRTIGHQSTQLRAAILEAEHANQTKVEFLSRVSHELRTPLNAVLGFGQLLEVEDDLSTDEQEAVGHILSAGRHLLNLIDELLDVAQTGSGTSERGLEPVLATEVFREALALVGPLARESGVHLRGERLAENDGLVVTADHQRLLQVLLNLLTNAVKYNHRGGMVIAECTAIDGGLVRLEVIDSGQGIDLEQLDRLFTPFDRLGAEQTLVEGSGIGLSLTLHLVETMGGSIAVDSAVGVGSTFAVDLQAADVPATVPHLRVVEADERLANLPFAPSATPSDLHGRILYIEDNRPNFELVQRILAEHPGLELIGATTGSEGYRLAVDEAPDLVLLDLQLADMPGLAVLAHLRADPCTRRVPVIVISADATAGTRSDLAEAGVDAYLTKPIEVAALLRHIADALPATRHPLDLSPTRSDHATA